MKRNEKLTCTLLVCTLCAVALVALRATTPATPAPPSAVRQTSDESRVSKGQSIPAFAVETLDGKTFDTTKLRGKVLLINFWATWCPPCRAEMPRLESDVWQKHKADAFAMVAVAREETVDEIAEYRREHGYTFPFAADPRRETYSLFAAQGIPRSYVVSANGKIVYESVGYDPKDFDEMRGVIAKELKKIAR